MSGPNLHQIAGALDARNQELAKELRRIEKRDWWAWGYTIFVMLLLVRDYFACTSRFAARG